MSTYLLYLLLTVATIASPGPGVVLTLSNAMRYGWRDTYCGILGLAAGSIVIAAASASGIGALLSVSIPAFTTVRLAGAVYLIFLGVRLWLADAGGLDRATAGRASSSGRFLEGVGLQLTNPGAILFFLAALPQFVETEAGRLAPRFAVLTFSYAASIFIIHSTYAWFAKRAVGAVRSRRLGHLINRIAGAFLVVFGALLAVGRR